MVFSLLVSCTHSSQDTFDNYIYRLINSLQLADNVIPLLKEPSFTSLPRFPSKKLLVQPQAQIDINLLEFLQLSSCDLQRHVGQRNSSLGKLMLPSQQLLYEYEFLVLAQQCLQTLPADHALVGVLNDVVAVKQKDLPVIKANAIFASEEFSVLFSLSSTPLTQDMSKTFPRSLLTALETIQQFVQKQPDNSKVIENAYAVIASSKRLGELRLSMQLVKHYLQYADQLLFYRIHNKPLCAHQKTNKQFDVVNTVFRKFYIGEVQPYLSAVYQQTEALFAQIEQVTLEVPAPKSFLMFWNQVYRTDNSEWQQFKTAVREHTKNWQRLLKQCGALPS